MTNSPADFAEDGMVEVAIEEETNLRVRQNIV